MTAQSVLLVHHRAAEARAADAIAALSALMPGTGKVPEHRVDAGDPTRGITLATFRAEQVEFLARAMAMLATQVQPTAAERRPPPTPPRAVRGAGR